MYLLTRKQKQISAVKGCKDQVYPQLKNFDYKKGNTLNDFIKEYEQQRSKNTNGFVKASELGKL